MRWTKLRIAAAGTVAVLVVASLVLPAIAKTKVRAAKAERMRMSKAMRAVQNAVVPALFKYAKAHGDDLPATLGELQEYMPPSTGIDDDHWQLLASGKLTPQLSRKDVVLMRQRNVPPGQLKMIGYMDGHFVFKKEG